MAPADASRRRELGGRAGAHDRRAPSGRLRDHTPWSNAVKAIVSQTEDLTVLWQVGVGKRREANARGFTPVDRPRVTPADVGGGGDVHTPSKNLGSTPFNASTSSFRLVRFSGAHPGGRAALFWRRSRRAMIRGRLPVRDYVPPPGWGLLGRDYVPARNGRVGRSDGGIANAPASVHSNGGRTPGERGATSGTRPARRQRRDGRGGRGAR